MSDSNQDGRDELHWTLEASEINEICQFLGLEPEMEGTKATH